VGRSWGEACEEFGRSWGEAGEELGRSSGGLRKELGGRVGNVVAEAMNIFFATPFLAAPAVRGQLRVHMILMVSTMFILSQS